MLAIVAPEEVPDTEIDAVVEEARAAVASGTLDVPDEPQPQLVEIGGRQISYLTLGPSEDAAPAGEPVVLVHGFGGDKNSWLFVQQPLAEQRTVHALDLPGHGASTRTSATAHWRRSPTPSSDSSTRWGSSGRTWSGTRWAGRSSRPWQRRHRVAWPR